MLAPLNQNSTLSELLRPSVLLISLAILTQRRSMLAPLNQNGTLSELLRPSV